MDDTLAPRERKIADSARSKRSARRKPVLASEVLREDLAPYQPGQRSGRLVFATLAAALMALGLSIRLGNGPGLSMTDAASLSFAAAGTLLAAAALPLPYLARAGVGVVVGVALLGLGFRGEGPLAALGASDPPPWQPLSRFVAMTTLPAALFFRAKYRAYKPARVALALAVGLAGPFVAGQFVYLVDGATPVVQKAGAVLDLVVVLCALLGFMGEDTTGGGTLFGSVQIGVLAGDLALAELVPLPVAGFGPLPHATTAVGLLCAAALVSIGLYHTLSSLLAQDARRASLNGNAFDAA